MREPNRCPFIKNLGTKWHIYMTKELFYFKKFYLWKTQLSQENEINLCFTLGNLKKALGCDPKVIGHNQYSYLLFQTLVWSHRDCTFIDNCKYDKSMKPFSQQESVMNAALNHYFHDHDENQKKVCLNSRTTSRRSFGWALVGNYWSNLSVRFD